MVLLTGVGDPAGAIAFAMAPCAPSLPMFVCVCMGEVRERCAPSWRAMCPLSLPMFLCVYRSEA